MGAKMNCANNCFFTEFSLICGDQRGVFNNFLSRLYFCDVCKNTVGNGKLTHISRIFATEVKSCWPRDIVIRGASNHPPVGGVSGYGIGVAPKLDTVVLAGKPTIEAITTRTTAAITTPITTILTVLPISPPYQPRQ
jgi:hypothetical protein